MIAAQLRHFGRIFAKNKISYFISFAGLSLSFAFTLAVMAAYYSAFRSDAWIEGADRLMVTKVKVQYPGFPRPFITGVPKGLDQAIVNYLPVGTETALSISQTRIVIAGDFVEDKNVRFLSENYSDLVNLPVEQGSLKEVLADLNAVAISRSYADKLFAGVNPIGQTITLRSDGVNRDVQVRAVLESMPSTSVFNADLFIRLDKKILEEANGFSRLSVLLRMPNAEGVAQNTRIFDEETRAAIWQQAGVIPDQNNSVRQFPLTFALEPLIGQGKEKFVSNIGFSDAEGISVARILPVLVALMVILAVASHIGLMIALVDRRVKEMVLRKIWGASQINLALSVIVEQITICLAAYVLGIVLAADFSGGIGGLIGFDVIIFSPAMAPIYGYGLLGVLGLALCISVYPIVKLSKIRPSALLQTSQQSVARGAGRLGFVVVMVQVGFAVSIGFFALVVYSQIDYLRNLDLGFDVEGLIYVDKPGKFNQENENFRNLVPDQFSKIDGVVGVAPAYSPPLGGIATSRDILDPRTNEELYVSFGQATKALLDVLGIVPVAGRLPDRAARGRPAQESNKQRAEEAGTNNQAPAEPEGEQKTNAPNPPRTVLINEALMRLLGYETYEDALAGCISQKNNQTSEISCSPIAAILPDVTGQIGSTDADPTVFNLAVAVAQYQVVRFRTQNVAKLLDNMTQAWREVFPNDPLTYSFVDEQFDAGFKAQFALAEVLLYCSFACLFMAVAGVYGHLQQQIRRGTKQIALRRVFGASHREIIVHMMIKYVRPALIGIVIALPMGWSVSSGWLSSFSSRVDFDWMIPVSVVISVFILLGMTVSGQVMTVLRQRPAGVLNIE